MNRLNTKNRYFTFEKATTGVAFFCGLFILLPFKIKPFTVLLFFILSLFSVINSKSRVKIETKTLVIYWLFFIGYAISLLFSENIQRALLILVRCVPLLIIPVAYSFLTFETKKQFNQLFRKTFIVATSLYSILIFIYLFQLGYFSHKHDLYYCYSYITYEFWGLNEHPIYLSVYFSISLFFILMEGFKSKIANFVLFLLLIFGLLILARKGAILSFIVLSSILLFLKKERHQNYKLLFVFISLFVLSLSLPEIRNRFLELFDTNKIVNNQETSSGIRYILWETSTKLIQKSNYLGYGIGDVQEVLSKQLATDGFTVLARDYYNAHNQFLQIGLATGVIGICLFLFSLFYFIRNFIRRKNDVAIVFFIFFISVFLFESFLERQNGTIIYSFITCMFIYSSEFDKTQQNET